MPKKSEFPKPTKRFLSGAWVILWRYSPKPGEYKQYTVSTGLTKEKADEPAADIILRHFAVALAQSPPKFPNTYASTSGVCRYLEDRLGTSNPIVESSRSLKADRWLLDYEPVIKKECALRWALNSLAYLRNLDQFVPGGIGNTDAFQAKSFLEHIHKHGTSKKSPKNTNENTKGQKKTEWGVSNGTRNRALAACSRFFGWCIESGRTTENPFKGIKALTEADVEDIVYCTVDERERIIAAAKATGRPDWIALPIAFYAGCRREEIFILEWKAINLDTRRIVVRRGKTGKRTIPIAKELLPILQQYQKRDGLVVPRDGSGTWENQADRLIEVIRARLCLPENPTLSGLPRECIGKWKFLMTEDEIAHDQKRRTERLSELEEKLKKINRDSKLAYNLAVDMGGYELTWKNANDGGVWMPAERVGWNAFRHTFGSLLAQAGVSLDKITSWMGNTPDICRRHYAQFVPRDRHDEDIDKL